MDFPKKITNDKAGNTPEYEPFGEEWEKEMMKWSKANLIDFLKQQCEKVKDADKREQALLLKAYIQGYETGHNDTVESCYTDSEQSGLDWIEQAREEGELK